MFFQILTHKKTVVVQATVLRRSKRCFKIGIVKHYKCIFFLLFSKMFGNGLTTLKTKKCNYLKIRKLHF